jgi:MoxR-like ATPase
VVDATDVPPDVARRVLSIVRRTRDADGVRLGASSRAAIHLLAASKARATLHGHRVARTEDVDATALLVLPHRIIGDDPLGIVRAAVADSP